MILTDDNFITYSMKHYDNPQCSTIEEFEEDLKRFVYLKKLLSRYRTEGIVRERLILNHIIVLYNIFGHATTNMLFFKVDRLDWPALTVFLIYLNRMPDKVEFHNISVSDITLDNTIISVLRGI